MYIYWHINYYYKFVTSHTCLHFLVWDRFIKYILKLQLKWKKKRIMANTEVSEPEVLKCTKKTIKSFKFHMTVILWYCRWIKVSNSKH